VTQLLTLSSLSYFLFFVFEKRRVERIGLHFPNE